ncbi:hypothetical protein, partial [Mycobacterium persicum]|uniref:hypothetical protein n=1 Tax=Mycobacterium persicum TaxID=1487726 RepID=UPI0016052394
MAAGAAGTTTAPQSAHPADGTVTTVTPGIRRREPTFPTVPALSTIPTAPEQVAASTDATEATFAAGASWHIGGGPARPS